MKAKSMLWPIATGCMLMMALANCSPTSQAAADDDHGDCTTAADDECQAHFSTWVTDLADWHSGNPGERFQKSWLGSLDRPIDFSAGMLVIDGEEFTEEDSTDWAASASLQYDLGSNTGSLQLYACVDPRCDENPGLYAIELTATNLGIVWLEEPGELILQTKQPTPTTKVTVITDTCPLEWGVLAAKGTVSYGSTTTEFEFFGYIPFLE